MNKKPISTKNQIMDYLQWSSLKYEDRLFTTYWNWCFFHGKSVSISQQLLANAKVNKWFLTEYDKLERQFLQIVNVTPCNVKLWEKHYKTTTAQIMPLYPKALVAELKMNTDFIKGNYQTDTLYYAN